MRESPTQSSGDPRNEFLLSAKLRAKLERFSQWRIDPSLIEFPGDASEFHGGHATVSRALLASTSDFKDIANKSEHQTDGRPNLDVQNPKSTGDAQEHEDSMNTKDECRNSHLEGEKDEANEEERKEYEGDEEQQKSSDQTFKPKIVAVKKLNVQMDADSIERALRLALREAECLVDLSHENIIGFEGFVEDVYEREVWLVFPWEENGNLRDFLTSGEWEIPERLWLLDDVARGLEYIHSQTPPICHGDLKSLNILVTAEYRAVITDFGSARRLTNEEPAEQPSENGDRSQPAGLDPGSDSEITPPQAVFCADTSTITLTGNSYTLRWAAPELLMDDRPGLGSDIWALGWVAYEVMTNNIPFQDVKGEVIVINRVIQGDLPSLTDDARMSLIQALCSLMVQCWNINPDKRPTAEDCRKSISWMPMLVPASKDIDPDTSEARHARLLSQIGRMYLQQGDYLNASDCITKALDMHPIDGNSRERAEALLSLADIHRFQDKYPEAIKVYSEVLQISTDIADRRGRANALWGLAEIHRYKNEYREAIKLYSEDLQIRTDIGDRQGGAEDLYGLAEIHRFRDELNEASELYAEALQTFTDTGSRRGRASALWGLAEIQRMREDYNKAIESYSKVLQLRTDIGDIRGRASALWGLANTHQSRADYNEAITLYSEALQAFTEIGDRKGRAQTLSGLADVHRLQDEYDAAISLYLEALQIRIDIGDRRGRADDLYGLAQTHDVQDHYHDAISLYTEASNIHEEIGDSKLATIASERAAEVRERLEKKG